jgi:hypothetical protein
MEKCKINEKPNFISRNIIDEESEIIENLPWKYYYIKKNKNNLTGYEIYYRNEIVKAIIEELISEYYIQFNFKEFKDKKYSNSVFGFFFEEFIKNKIKKEKKFLNFEIQGIIILKSIYSNDNWEFIKKCDIKKNKCYLITQHTLNAPYYDIGILIPKGNNFFIILIQISVHKSFEKREKLTINFNYNRFLKIKKKFENNFPYILEDGDFVYLLYEKYDEETINYSIKNCIKCISYYNEGYLYWNDNFSSSNINEFPNDEFTILNSIDNETLNERKKKIMENKRKLNNLKDKPSLQLNLNEKKIIKLKIVECSGDNIKFENIIMNFVEKNKSIIEPKENEILIYIQKEKKRNKKLGYSFKLINKIYYFSFYDTHLDKSESSIIDKYHYKNKKLYEKNKINIGKKRNKRFSKTEDN